MATTDASTDSRFDREAVDRFLDDRPDTRELRPALQALSKNQRELVGRFVDGFDDRAEFLLWCQDSSIALLGELDDDWGTERAFSRLDMQAVITSSRRYDWADVDEATGEADAIDEADARWLRRGVAAIDLLPAATRAYRRLRWSATEYVNDDDDTFRPESGVQKHTAMRPALSELDTRQEFALNALLDGFDSDDALLAWVQAVTEASYAEVDDDLAARVYAERNTREALTADVDDARAQYVREGIAARYLLPAFNRSAHAVADRAGELAESEHKDTTPKLI